MIGIGGEILVIHHFNGKMGNDYYLLSVPAVFFLFYYVSQIELNKSNKYIIFRKISTLVYLCHLWIKAILEYILNFFCLDLSKSCLLFLSTVIISIFFFILYNQDI